MKQPNYSDISIVMLVKNELTKLEKSLPIVLSQEGEYSYEILIIDSGSTDGSLDFIKKIASNNDKIKLHIISPEEFHHARTRNLGASMTNGRYLVFLGGDAIPLNKLWLQNLVAPLDGCDSNQIAACYGKQIPKKNADIMNTCRITYNYPDKDLIKDMSFDGSTKEKYFFSSVNCAINRKAFDGAIFSENIPVIEDIYFSYTAIQAGYKIVYSGKAAVEHSHNCNFYEIFQRYFDWIYNYDKIGVFKNESKAMSGEGLSFLKHSLSLLQGRPANDWIKYFIFIIFMIGGVKLGQWHRFFPKSFLEKVSKYGL